jgi:tetratricopeptide (TPR) repeat protein
MAIAIDPFYRMEDTDALISKGLALYNLGRTEEAIQYYDRALAIDPEDVDAQSNKDSALSSLAK